ncbi:MAG: rod shape-determining protein MreC [Endomicrobiales bacterium]|nr:rod shape-determining protein MreC [Endomicrobiales bacterium]
MEDFLTRRRSSFTFLFLTAINIALLTAHLTGYVGTIKDLLYYVLFPAQDVSARIVRSGQKFSQNVSEVINVHQENAKLKKMLEKYAYLETEYRRFFEENERLRNLVNFPKYWERKQVAANVITREPQSWFQWVIIDKGADDGIYLDVPVVAWVRNSPAVLGRVAEVYQNSSKVVLITNALSATPAQVKPHNEDGLVQGQNSQYLVLDYLLPESRVLVGNEVYTGTLSSVFPPGVLIGKISDFAPSESDEFKSAVIRPAVNFSSLREVVALVGTRQQR